MSETNYSWTRQKFGLESWDDDQQRLVTREPTPAELLRLLDALHADIEGTRTPEYEEALSQRYYYW
ncbi:hypothetical protein [Mycobacterium phage WXIN]|nr:hypothetical protein [Mycobacterium phage WXIN]